MEKRDRDINIILLLLTHIVYLSIVLFLLFQLGSIKESMDTYYMEKIENYIRDNSVCFYGSERNNASNWAMPEQFLKYNLTGPALPAVP